MPAKRASVPDPAGARNSGGRAKRPLKTVQREFAAHIRDPDRQPPPAGVEERRMKVYRDLFFNNIQSLLSSNFPVIRSLLDDEDWRRLVRAFYASHRCQTPLFPEVAREFLRFLQDEYTGGEDGLPFLLELAHYEWIELALELDEREIDDVAAVRGGDLLEGIPVLSPLAWPLGYRFPVHRIRRDYQPRQAPAEPTHLLVWRNRQDKVRFMQLNDVSRLLLESMQSDPELTGRRQLERVAEAIRHPAPEKVITSGAALLSDLESRDILLGIREVR
jgi:hypothetical protein